MKSFTIVLLTALFSATAALAQATPQNGSNGQKADGQICCQKGNCDARDPKAVQQQPTAPAPTDDKNGATSTHAS